MELGLLCRAIAEWVATLGKRLFTGNSLASTPAPVIIFEPRSNLQKLTDCWVYTSLLEDAAQASDALSRLKYVVAWFVAGSRHMFDTWRKPFNPILGETWQSVNNAGCYASLAQASHHPPVASYKLSGPGYKMRGTTELMIHVRYAAPPLR
jgi:Oxysterol-binding protein